MLIYLWVKTGFRYLVAKYFLSIFKIASFIMALMCEKQVYLIKWTIAWHHREASDKKFMCVRIVDIFFFFWEKKEKKSSPSR